MAMTTELMPTATRMKVLDRPENESVWPVVIDRTEHPRDAGASHSVNGYAALRKLMERFPDALRPRSPVEQRYQTEQRHNQLLTSGPSALAMLSVAVDSVPEPNHRYLHRER